MAPATEIATLPLTAGATIEDANSPTGKVWQSTLDTVSAQVGFLIWPIHVKESDGALLDLALSLRSMKRPAALLFGRDEKG